MIDLVMQLSLRLPALAYHLEQFQTIPVQWLPKGMFRCVAINYGVSVQDCMMELEEDVSRLKEAISQEKSMDMISFLVKNLSQKMSVLVRCCTLHQKKKSGQTVRSFELTELATREQWLTKLSNERERLLKQKKAFHDLATQPCSQKGILDAQEALADIERQLLLIEQSLSQMG